MDINQAYANLSARLPIDDKGVLARLGRAYDIVTKEGYDVKWVCDLTWHVSKASTSLLEDTSACYVVDAKERTCTCPDFDTARGGLCKHRLAVMLLMEMDKAI